MNIEVKVIPNAKKNQVLEEEGRFKVYVNVPAVDGKANKALIEVLADHFNVKKSNVEILRGETSRVKVIKINLEDC